MSQKEAPRIGLLKALVARRVTGREVCVRRALDTAAPGPADLYDHHDDGERATGADSRPDARHPGSGG